MSLSFGSVVQLCPVNSDGAISVSPSPYDDGKSVVTVGARDTPLCLFKLLSISTDPQRDSPITFNEDFFLQIVTLPDSLLCSTNKLFEHSMDMDFYRCHYTKGHLQQPVAVTKGNETCLSFCRWRFVHPDPEFRFEMEGEPVDHSEPVLILHSSTNKFLTPQFDRQKFTVFGQQSPVSVSYRAQKSRDLNGLWRIAAQRKREDAFE